MTPILRNASEEVDECPAEAGVGLVDAANRILLKLSNSPEVLRLVKCSRPAGLLLLNEALDFWTITLLAVELFWLLLGCGLFVEFGPDEGKWSIMERPHVHYREA